MLHLRLGEDVADVLDGVRPLGVPEGGTRIGHRLADEAVKLGVTAAEFLDLGDDVQQLVVIQRRLVAGEQRVVERVP